ncbi:MAG: hypothetical protein P4L84_32215 [Isosphaeraceae bacterium]|nr:hypothetical protein [Isosphaeraceae bacterium]
MTRIITIRLEVPEDVEVRIGGGPLDDSDDEPLPPASWAAPAEPEPTFRTIAAGRNGSAAGVCPVHRVPWRQVPAGTSKRTGRSYAAFLACSEPGCDERPPVSRRSAS